MKPNHKCRHFEWVCMKMKNIYSKEMTTSLYYHVLKTSFCGEKNWKWGQVSDPSKATQRVLAQISVWRSFPPFLRYVPVMSTQSEPSGGEGLSGCEDSSSKRVNRADKGAPAYDLGQLLSLWGLRAQLRRELPPSCGRQGPGSAPQALWSWMSVPPLRAALFMPKYQVQLETLLSVI